MIVKLVALLVFLVAAGLAYLAGPFLHLQGTSLLLLRVLLCAVGVAAAAAILYLQARSKKREDAAGETGDGTGAGDAEDLDSLLKDAARKLGTSQQGGAKALAGMPVLYVLGDADAAKTTTILHSGLEPELIAGQVHRAGEVTATPLLNIWYTRQIAIVDAGEAIRSRTSLWERLARRTRPKAFRSVFGASAPARAAVVCVSMERFLGPDAANASVASARATGVQLRTLSRVLGTAVPVYVIFTKLDRVPYFAEFAARLSNDEAQQVLGSTFAPDAASSGLYAERATQAVTQALETMVFSLSEFRLDLLEREADGKSAAEVYEFPRELRKLRNNLAQYLVELARPSQLSTNPYLRGFYFTGVRAQVIEQVVSTPAAPKAAAVQDAGATRMFTLQEMRQAAQEQPSVVSKRAPQWTFLPRIFPRVILEDKSALAASQENAPARFFRRTLFGLVAVACAVYLLLLFLSYRNNFALEQRILDAGRALPAAGSPTTGMATLRDVEALDQLRQTVEELEGYRQNDAPWRYRWGLYQGDRLLTSARQSYFAHFRPLLLTATQAHLQHALSALPDAPAAGDNYTAAYNPLKAYLITTSNPEKSTPEFLTPVLMQHWMNGAPVDAEEQRLTRQQMDFYANELRRANPYSIDADASAVGHARAYLSKFGGVDRIYQGMLAAANKSAPAIEFNRQFPRASEVVVDAHVVPGAFTRPGFAFMQEAIQHPDRYFSGETWVLGNQAAPSLDRASITQQLMSLYVADYLKEWRAFLSAANVVGYRNLPDAAAKLNLLANPTSPLLELFYTISHNTAVGNAEIAHAFQPAAAVVAPENADRLIGAGNASYVNALLALQGSIAQATQNPAGLTDPNAGVPILGAATQAHIAARQAGQAFTIDPQTHAETAVINLMEAPIKSAEVLVRGIGPAATNGAGHSFCASFDALTAKFPFAANSANQASVAEVAAVLAPESGALWQFYNANLKTVLLPQGTQYGPAPNAAMQVTPSFTRFFNRAAAISAGLFPQGAKTPTLTFSMREVPTKGIQNATLSVDGQRISSANAVQQFTWNAQSAQQAQLSASYLDAKDVPLLQSHGTWALFDLLNKAHVQRAGGATQLAFPLEVSNSPIKLPDGTPLAVVFELSGPGAEVLTPGALSGLHCVSQVVR